MIHYLLLSLYGCDGRCHWCLGVVYLLLINRTALTLYHYKGGSGYMTPALLKWRDRKGMKNRLPDVAVTAGLKHHLPPFAEITLGFPLQSIAVARPRLRPPANVVSVATPPEPVWIKPCGLWFFTGRPRELYLVSYI